MYTELGIVCVGTSQTGDSSLVIGTFSRDLRTVTSFIVELNYPVTATVDSL